MYLYECRRWDSEEDCTKCYRGALIIAANNKEDALLCYSKNTDEFCDGECEEIVDLRVTLFQGEGKAYVVYNDYCR